MPCAPHYFCRYSCIHVSAPYDWGCVAPCMVVASTPFQICGNRCTWPYIPVPSAGPSNMHTIDEVQMLAKPEDIIVPGCRRGSRRLSGLVSTSFATLIRRRYKGSFQSTLLHAHCCTVRSSLYRSAYASAFTIDSGKAHTYNLCHGIISSSSIVRERVSSWL